MKIKFDTRDIKKLSSDLADVSKASSKVVTRAINKTLTGVRTDAVKEIRDEITPKAKLIRKSMAITRASQSRQKGKVSSKGKNLSLIHFRARQTARGVSVHVEKKSPRYFIGSAFIGQARHEKQVFKRDYAGKARGSKKKTRKNIPYAALPEKFRLPIRRRVGPSIPDIMGKQRVLAKIEHKAADRLRKNIAHEMDWELNKLTRG